MTKEKNHKKFKSFWVGPLLAGSCFAAGYQITQRAIIQTSSLPDTNVALFEKKSVFPGVKLETLIQNRRNPTELMLSEEKISYLAQMMAPENKTMQKLLKALKTKENYLINQKEMFPNSSSTQIQQQASRGNKVQSIFQSNDYEKLFQTLPKP